MGSFLTTDRYSTVLAWADWHAGVISRDELAALGVPPTTITSWLRTRRLTRLHRAVFAVGHTAIRPEGRWRAASLTCGPRSALSHHTGMLALGHWAPDHHQLHLTTPGSGRSRGELRVHRSPLAAVDVTLRHGLRVTALERTLVDLADLLTWRELVTVADRLWDIDPRALDAARERAGHRVGRHRSRQLAEREEPHTRSEFEREFLRFLRRHGLPRPARLNQPVGRFVVDAVYPEAPLAVELDGRAYHARRREVARDRHREADLQALGYRVLRLVWEDLYDEQTPETIRRLTELARLRGA
jgi:very-short-patch-repair endonuclease